MQFESLEHIEGDSPCRDSQSFLFESRSRIYERIFFFEFSYLFIQLGLNHTIYLVSIIKSKLSDTRSTYFIVQTSWWEIWSRNTGNILSFELCILFSKELLLVNYIMRMLEPNIVYTGALLVYFIQIYVYIMLGQVWFLLFALWTMRSWGEL